MVITVTGVYHRVRAARSGEKISRREEGLPIMMLGGTGQHGAAADSHNSPLIAKTLGRG